MNHLVELVGVGKRYREVEALRDLDLSLAAGEVLGLLGHNGAGKTTAIKLLLGLIVPEGGRVTVFGRDPAGRHAHELRRKLGYLPENVTFYPQLTGRETLNFFARLKGDSKARCAELLERVGLNEAAGRRVGTYSKGMRQRLGLAQALLGEPQLLLLDEPTVGLDPLATRDFYDLIDQLRNRGVAVVLCSHVLPGIERHVDRVAILGHGRLLAAGDLSELRRQAGLPALIRARGRLSDRARLESLGARVVRETDPLELTVAPAHKLAVVKALLEGEDLEDLEVRPSTLEALYLHFSQRPLEQN